MTFVTSLRFDGIFPPSIKQPDSVTICVWAQVTYLIPRPRVAWRSVCFLRLARIPCALTEAFYNLDSWKFILIYSSFLQDEREQWWVSACVFVRGFVTVWACAPVVCDDVGRGNKNHYNNNDIVICVIVKLLGLIPEECVKWVGVQG